MLFLNALALSLSMSITYNGSSGSIPSNNLDSFIKRNNDSCLIVHSFSFSSLVNYAGFTYDGLTDGESYSIVLKCDFSETDGDKVTSYSNITLLHFDFVFSNGTFEIWDNYDNDYFLNVSYACYYNASYNTTAHYSAFSSSNLMTSQQSNQLLDTQTLPVGSSARLTFDDIMLTFFDKESLEAIGYKDEGYGTYQDGYNDGLKDGKAMGDGDYSDGYRDGRADGYTEGVNASSFSFLNLFGAIADTPVMMIRRLFNFDLFGTSMVVVALSLLSFLILLKVVKKVIK